MAAKNSLMSDDGSKSCDTNVFMSELPVELKLKVLSYVDIKTIRKSVALVNKEFNQLTKDYSLYEQYETPDFDILGSTTRLVLDNPLYKSHLSTLFTNAHCLRKLDLRPFVSLKKIIIKTVIENISLPLDSLCQLKNISIVVSDKSTLIDFDKRMVSLPIKVEVLHIGREEEIKNMLSISAGRYLLGPEIVSSTEVLQRFLTGDFAYLLQMDNVQFSINSSARSYFSQNPLPLNFIGKLVRINIELDCRIAEHREAIETVCKHCSLLEHLNLELINIDNFPTIENVESKQLQTLSFRDKDGKEKLSQFPMCCGPLLTAVKLEIILINLKNIPLEVLRCLSPLLSSLKLMYCEWSEDISSFIDGKLPSTLKLINTNPASIPQLYIQHITKLEISFSSNFVEIQKTLQSLCSLEEFFIGSSDTSVETVLEALLPSKDTLRVLRVQYMQEPIDDAHYTLQLLRQFRQLQFFVILGGEEFRSKQIKEFFSTAVIDIEKVGSFLRTTILF